MKKLVYLTMLLVLVLGTVSVAAQAPEKPAPDLSPQLGTAPRAGIGNITGSTVNFVTPDYLPPGPAFDLCFNVTNTSNDAEYLDGFDFDLPDNWTVNYVTDVPGDGCSNGHTYGVGAGNVVFWYTNGMPSGCGDWYYGTRDFCANVTIPDCSGSPWDLNWNIWGDTWGGEPHSVSGTAVKECQAAGIFLNPVEQSGSACEGEAIVYSLNLFNNAGYDATFDLDYTSVFPISGPQSIFVANGSTGFFDVEVTVPCGGVNDTATVTASDATYSDSSWLITSVSAGGWGTIPASAPSWAGIGYPRDGCSALNAAGEWVTYIFGDTTSIFGFWGYNHATNAWFQPGAANTPADRWAPDWAYDAATNLCYVTGGANTPGGGNYNTAYVFDPVANAFTALPSFTSMRDFHNSWVGTIDGTKYLCIGGGVNASSVMIQATQCYDIAGGFWNAENAQMAAFPTDPFGAADGILHAPGGDQFWYVGGAINAGGAVSDEARYWDDADNAWHTAGNTGAARYRVEGDFLDGAYYQLGGSSGGFSPTTDIVVGTFDGTNWNWAITGQLANARMDNIATIADGTIWSVDGYGATSANYVEKLIQCEPCSGDLTLTCGDFVAQPAMDPFGRIYVRWKVEAVDQDGLATAFVAVDAQLWSPQGGPWSRTRWTHWDGFARFPWGSNYSGDWQIDVTNMTLQGYTFIDGANCTATGYW